MTDTHKTPGSRFWLITTLRSLMWCLIIFSLNIFVDSQAPSTLLYIAAIAGCSLGSRLALSSLSLRGLIIFSALGIVSAQLISWFFFQLPISLSAEIQGLLWSEQLAVGISVFVGALSASWFFWRYSFGLAIEVLLLIITLISVLSEHRNYRFDLVKLVNDLAWDFHMSPLAMLVIIGTVFLGVISVYLLSQNLVGRPGQQNSPKVYHRIHRTSPLLLVVFIALFLGLTTLTARAVFFYHQKKSATQVSNGVGQEQTEGLSPLTFHQSLGKSNQPMAVLRLDAEYQNNPDTPSLYLRETALSELHGNEMVIAAEKFDRDVPRVQPGKTYVRTEGINASSIERSEITQSVYLIAKHKLLFAVDFPTRLSLLNLPADNKRFKSAFRAYSLVPHYDRSLLEVAEVGDPQWDQASWQHYTKPHQDQRYTDLAKKIAGDLTNTTAQALAIVKYLSKNAIYTLTPNHKGGSKDDQTAEFLFGDLRGYCVHFAHASVFLFRALGIPARIATGYLSDLSQSRDGHVLLRSSDRHAWAEVYFTGIGWVTMDTEPEQVESHAESPVDMDLLDQLMSEIGSDSELLPEVSDSDFPEEERNNPFLIEGKNLIRMLLLVTLVALALILISKTYLRYSWTLTASPAKRLARIYRAAVSTLYDLGFKRKVGETRAEYRQRIKQALNIDLLVLTPKVLEILYNPKTNFDQAMIVAANTETRKLLGSLSRQQRYLSLINPSSAINFLLRRGW